MLEAPLNEADKATGYFYASDVAVTKTATTGVEVARLYIFGSFWRIYLMNRRVAVFAGSEYRLVGMAGNKENIIPKRTPFIHQSVMLVA